MDMLGIVKNDDRDGLRQRLGDPGKSLPLDEVSVSLDLIDLQTAVRERLEVYTGKHARRRSRR